VNFDVGLGALQVRLENPCFEIIPLKGVDKQIPHIPAGSDVAITCSPDKGIPATLDLTRRLRDRGFTLIPHIAARMVTDGAHLRDILAVLDDLEIHRIFVVGGDAESDSVADLIAAGGNCEAVAPEVSARITGPHNADPGDSVVLTAVAEGFDEGTETYLWNDASTAATLDLGVVDAGDTGVYTCTVGGDAGGEAADPVEASFTLWVGVATPLAGGLGLGLLVGACALAGAVSIRRKK